MWPRHQSSGYSAAWQAVRSPLTAPLTIRGHGNRRRRATSSRQCCRRVTHGTRRNGGRQGRPAPAMARPARRSCRAWPPGSCRARQAARSRDGGRGRCQPASRLAVRSVALRSDPLAPAPVGVHRTRGGAGAARAAARRGAGRHLRAAGPAGRWRTASGTRVCQSGLPSTVPPSLDGASTAICCGSMPPT